MKKIILTALVAIASITANAQVWVGGQLGFSVTNNDATDKNLTEFTIAPEIGYSLSDKWDIAIALGDKYSKPEDFDATNDFFVNPYARYTFLKAGNFSAFVDGGVSYGLIHVSSMSQVMNNINSLGVAINPGVTYAVSPKVSLVAHIGDLSYNAMWTKAKNADVKVNNGKFNIGIWNAISFGAYYNF